MTQTRLFILAAVLSAFVAPVLAQPSAAGEWKVNFVVPSGTKFVNMVINQEKTRLTGTVISEDGEFPLTGRIIDDQVTVVWTVPEDGQLMEITMKGKLAGNVITGTAKLGNVGEGSLTARREAEGEVR
jgi:hypothetical protein